MQLKKKLSILFCLFFVSLFSIQSQEKQQLQTYLSKVEKHFGISFSYLERHIDKQIMPLDFQGHDLFSLLLSLEKQTDLRFEKLSPLRFTIRPLKPNDLVTICGNIKDQFKNVPDNVSLALLKGEEIVSVTPEGFFEVKNVRFDEVITIKQGNFVVRSISIKELFQPQCLTITVYNKEIKLEEVVVKNYIAKGFRLESEKIVFKPSEFKVIAGLTTPDIMQAIQQVPGVISPFESASRIFVRGGTPDQNLVRWNGITTYNQSHFFGMLSAFNPNVIDEVDFYKNSVNAEFGHRVGGVVEMKTANSIANTFSGSAGSNLLHADMNAKIPLLRNRISLTVSGRRSFTDIWASPTYNQLSKRIFQNSNVQDAEEDENDFFFYDATFTLNVKPSLKDHIQANVLVSKNDLNFSKTNEEETQQDDLVTQNVGYSLQWKRKWNDRWSHNANLYNSRYLLDYAFFQDTNDELKSSTRTNFVNDLGVETTIQYQKEKTKITLGTFYSQNNVRYAFETEESGFEIQLDNNSNQLITQGSFADYTFFKPKKYKISLGLRATDYNNSSRFLVEPRIYGEKFFGNFSLNFSYNRQTQAVTQIRESEFNTLSLENLVWRATQKDYETVRGDHYNIGGTFKHRKWFFEVEGYYKQLKNITSFASGFLNILSNERTTGESRTCGAEVFVKRKFKHWETWLNYTHLNQRNRFEILNNNRFYKSNINIDHTFKWVTNWNWKRWYTSTSWLLHTGKTTVIANDISEEGEPVQIDFSNLISGKLPIYHRLDVSIKYRLNSSKNPKIKYDFGISVQNIYDFQTIINREFRISPGIGEELRPFDYTSLGITSNLSFRVSF